MMVLVTYDMGTQSDNGKRRLRQIDILQVLIEVCFGSLCKAANCERATLPKIDPVGIELENLLLAELLLHFHGNQHFSQLAPHGFFRRQKKTARQLHGQGRSPLLMSLPDQIDPCSLPHANKIHAAMLEEPPVFDGENRIDHHLRNVVVLHQLPLRVEQRGQRFWLQLVSVQRTAAPAGDARNLAILEVNRRRIGIVIRGWPRLDLNPVVDQLITA